MKTSKSGLLFSALNIDCLPVRPNIASTKSQAVLAQAGHVALTSSEEASLPPQAGLKLESIDKGSTSEPLDPSDDESFKSLPWRRCMTGDSLDSEITFPVGSRGESTSMLHGPTFQTNADDKQSPNGPRQDVSPSRSDQADPLPPETLHDGETHSQKHDQFRLQLAYELSQFNREQRNEQRNRQQMTQSSADVSPSAFQWNTSQDDHGMVPCVSPYFQNSVSNASNVQFICGPVPIPMPVLMQVNLCRNCGVVVKLEFNCHNCGARLKSTLADVQYQ
mmetsp:Transcript_6140/g.9960  ORF Transcript_6140/g.9960 Transcript_6140/m.9960 type:complete len:277 (-) Transcript_6140:14-844(-)